MDWDSDEENVEEGKLSNEPTDLLIAIDASEVMFEDDKKFSGSIFRAVLHSCYEMLDNMLLKTGRGGGSHIAVAVVSDDLDKLTVCDFKDPLPTSLKILRKLCDKGDQELQDMYMRRDPLNVADFLIQCKKKLSTRGQTNVKYIAYITNCDNPVVDDEEKKFHAVNQAKTLVDFNIYIELLTFNPEFDYGVFFQEVLFSAKSKFNYEYFVDLLGLKEKLLSLVRFKGFKVRFYPFNGDHGGQQKYFDVIEKRYIKKQKLLNNVRVTKDTNEEVKRVKRGITQLNTYTYKYSKHQDPIEITAGERDAMIYDGIPTGFQLLSVCPKLLKPGWHITDPKFIQSNRKQNLPYFDLFWQFCVDKNRVLVCARKYRKDGSPKLVELSPKMINNVRSFLVLAIPNREDVTLTDIEVDESQTPTFSEENLGAAEEFVKAATFKYDPLMFHDSVYCKKKEYVRSQLLEEPPREVDNIVKVKVIQEDISEVVRLFKDAYISEYGGGGKRRKPAPKSSQSKKKK